MPVTRRILRREAMKVFLHDAVKNVMVEVDGIAVNIGVLKGKFAATPWLGRSGVFDYGAWNIIHLSSGASILTCSRSPAARARPPVRQGTPSIVTDWDATIEAKRP